MTTAPDSADGTETTEDRLRRLEAQLAETEAELVETREEATTASVRLLDALESLTEGFVLLNAEMSVAVANDRLGALFGGDHWEPGRRLSAVAESLSEAGFRHVAKDGDAPVEALLEALASGDAADGSILWDGDGRWLSLNARGTFDGGMVATFTDITDLTLKQQELARQSALLQTTMDSINEGIAAFANDGTMVARNALLAEVTGLDGDTVAAGLLGHADFLDALAARGFFGPGNARELSSDRLDAFDRGSLLKDFEQIVDGRHVALNEFSMSGGGHVKTFRDVTERREAEAQLYRRATFDELTGLPNRAVGIDRLQAAVSSAERSKRDVAVLFIDLDGFKKVNDTLGHEAGDVLLQGAARRMENCVRKSDTVARLGGDEFLVLLPDMEDIGRAVVVAQKIISALTQPFDIAEQEVGVSASVGISGYPEDAADADELLRTADIAMYAAKHGGKNTYRHYSPRLDDTSRRRQDLETALAKAVKGDELDLLWLPVFDLKRATTIGIEALLRWRRPDGRTLEPDDFIPLIEDADLMLAAGHRVLDRVCAQAAAWDAAGIRLPVTVNLSAKEFRNPKLLENVGEALATYSVPPERLRFDITETVLVRDPDGAMKTLEKLRAFGISTTLDDFGIGRTSLTDLRSYPFDSVKIDRALIASAERSEADASLIRAVVSAAGSMGLTTVAEGVETETQAGFLRDIGCTAAQGFWFGAPVQADGVRNIVLGRAAAASAGPTS